jgi:Dyp-type peroxidase family
LTRSPQGGIFALGTSAHAYLEFDGRAGVDPRDLVTAVSSLREPRTTMGGVNLVAGFRPELWRAAVPDDAPVELAGFNDEVIGADGFDSMELEDLAPDSHVASTNQQPFGTVFRRNMPYGTVSDHGTMFVGFGSEQRVLAEMLESMAGLAGGERDALTRYTRPLTGAYYFVPAAEALLRLTGRSQ